VPRASTSTRGPRNVPGSRWSASSTTRQYRELTPSRVGRVFAALLDKIESNGVRLVLVEDASRFARDLVAQELGLLALIKRDVRVLTATGDDMTDTSDPSRIMMRQIAGSFAQYEKARLVGKLRAARENKRKAAGKCEGRKAHASSVRSMLGGPQS
jgi:DNA invertase Pin-like site-specific DNA recombinase